MKTGFNAPIIKSEVPKRGKVKINFLFVLILVFFLVVSIIFLRVFHSIILFFVFLFTGFVLSQSPKIVKEWEKGIVLRFGRFRKQIGPGLFWVVPFIDRVVMWIDQRVMTTGFMAEKTLTKDTVPVNVDAVLFWVVWDAKKAALEVSNYYEAISWAAQTALRDIIGKTELSDLLKGRDKIDKQLQKIIDARTEPWGITVQSVEIRDIVIPPELEEAMSRQAQAERERLARVILGDAETQIADKFVKAAEKYQDNQIAFHLRAMNMLYEGLKEKGALIIVPSTAVESMGLGTITGLTALYNKDKK
ncbi:slipin family protein [candidate division KSB1 bacterium]|nr:MAG: slipin family protein [candidate division KSB1 bacterium]